METLALPHTVKIYECDRKKQLRLHCLFNLFQDAADMHADVLGVGYEYCLSRGIGWVGANYHLKINRLPLWQEKIVLTTWASGKTVVSGIRDFNIRCDSCGLNGASTGSVVSRSRQFNSGRGFSAIERTQGQYRLYAALAERLLT